MKAFGRGSGRFGLAVVAALALAACGSGGSDGADDTGDDVDTTVESDDGSGDTQPPDATDAPDNTTNDTGDDDADAPAGGTLTVAMGADAQPQFVTAVRAGNLPWRNQVFDTLTSLDPESGEPQPLVATEWAFNDDSTEIVLSLRDDVMFHSGRQMTADDVVFSLEQAKLPESATQTGSIIADSTITASADNEVTITSTKPIPNVFDTLELAAIVDQETVAGLQDGSEVIGTGPFTWTAWEPGASLQLDRFDDYWGGSASLDSIEFVIITDPSAQISAMTSGRAQIATGVSNTDATTAVESGSDLRLGETPVQRWYPLGMDTTQPPFDDPAVRQAVGYAIDRERIIDQVFEGLGETSDLWWKSNEPGMTDDLVQRYSYDPDRARDMLVEAGVDGTEIEFTTLNLPAAQSVFEIIQNNLNEVGFTVKPNVVDTAIFDERQAAGDLGPIFLQLHGLQGFSPATLVDALPALRDGNPSKFDDPKYRDLRDALQAAGEDDEEAALVELTEYMLDQAFSHATVRTTGVTIESENLEGVKFTNVGYWILHGAGISD